MEIQKFDYQRLLQCVGGKLLDICILLAHRDILWSQVTENMLFIDSQEYSLEPISEDSFQHLHFEEQCKVVTDLAVLF